MESRHWWWWWELVTRVRLIKLNLPDLQRLGDDDEVWGPSITAAGMDWKQRENLI